MIFSFVCKLLCHSRWLIGLSGDARVEKLYKSDVNPVVVVLVLSFTPAGVSLIYRCIKFIKHMQSRCIFLILQLRCLFYRRKKCNVRSFLGELSL